MNKENVSDKTDGVFKSKVDRWIVAAVVVGFGWTVLLPWLTGDAASYVVVLIMLTAGAAVVILLRRIRYVVSGAQLRVYCPPLRPETYDLRELLSVRATHNPLSAPAASLDRLELTFTHHRSLLISPKDKAAFITLIKTVNPAVVLKNLP